MNWKLDIDLPKRCRRFGQKCNLLFDGPLSKRVTIEQKCNYLLLWSGDHGLDLFNTWELNEDQNRRKTSTNIGGSSKDTLYSK